MQTILQEAFSGKDQNKFSWKVSDENSDENFINHAKTEKNSNFQKPRILIWLHNVLNTINEASKAIKMSE